MPPPSPQRRVSKAPPPADDLCRVLLIEDNDADAYLFQALTEAITDSAFDVTRAGSLAGGLRALRETDADLIVLDLYLPDSEGMATFHAVREHTSSPVIVLSGLADVDTALAAVQAGAQ